MIKTQPKLKDFLLKLKLFFSKLNFPANPLDVIADEWVKKTLWSNVAVPTAGKKCVIGAGVKRDSYIFISVDCTSTNHDSPAVRQTRYR